jgi:hypothetical protein
MDATSTPQFIGAVVSVMWLPWGALIALVALFKILKH